MLNLVTQSMEQNILTAGPGKDTEGLIPELEPYKTRRNLAGKKWGNRHSGRKYGGGSHRKRRACSRKELFAGEARPEVTLFKGKKCFLKTDIKQY